jgi:peptidoglycan-associated lipoprotein
MRKRCSFLVVTSLLVVAAGLTGCAKRPATTQAAAPAPTGTASTTAAAQPAPSSPSSTESSSSSQGGGAGAAGGATAAPTTQNPASDSSGSSGSQTTTPAPATAAARPVVKDFAPVPDLRDIYFDFDKYEIRAGDAKMLDANAAWLKSNPDHLVLIEGHCDERGTNEYNLALGERRAKSTMNYLVAQGVQANRITIISYGEERPVCTEHTEECWAKNRRAHFLVKPR